MSENKKNKSVLPLIALGGVFLFSKLAKKNNANTNNVDLKKALAEQRQNNAYEVILSDGGGDEVIDKIINQDFILGENNLPMYDPNQVYFFSLPDSLKVQIGQFTKDVSLDKRYFTTKAFVTNKGDYSDSFFNQFYIKPYDYYLKINCIVCLSIPKSGYTTVNLDTFLIQDIMLQYKNMSIYGNAKPYFLNYLKNNDFQQFWTPQEFEPSNKAGDVLVTKQFENTIKKNEYKFKAGLNYLNLEFILPQKLYYKENGVEKEAYQIYMSNQGRNTNDFNAISFLQLLKFKFNIIWEIKKFNNTITKVSTIQFADESFYNRQDNGKSIFIDLQSTGGGGQPTTDSIKIDPNDPFSVSAKQQSKYMSVNNQEDNYKDFGYLIGSYGVL